MVKLHLKQAMLCDKKWNVDNNSRLTYLYTNALFIDTYLKHKLQRADLMQTEKGCMIQIKQIHLKTVNIFAK